MMKPIDIANALANLPHLDERDAETLLAAVRKATRPRPFECLACEKPTAFEQMRCGLPMTDGTVEHIIEHFVRCVTCGTVYTYDGSERPYAWRAFLREA